VKKLYIFGNLNSFISVIYQNQGGGYMATRKFDIKIFLQRLGELLDRESSMRHPAYHIAEKIGISRSTLSKYKTGVTLPPPSVLVALSNVFHVSTDYLLGLTDIKNPDTSTRNVCIYSGLDEDALNGLLKLTKPSHSVSAGPHNDLDMYMLESLSATEQAKVDEFDIELPCFGSKPGAYIPYQHLRPSRKTIINELLKSSEFAYLLDMLRDGIQAIITCNLRARFAEIHPYLGSDDDKFNDTKHRAYAKLELQEAITAVLNHLVDIYTEKIRFKIDRNIQEYTNAAKKYDIENEF
jgi:transcriptional regulator with XRE-family HTH domain